MERQDMIVLAGLALGALTVPPPQPRPRRAPELLNGRHGFNGRGKSIRAANHGKKRGRHNTRRSR